MVDDARLQHLLETMTQFVTGGTMCASVWIGDELGLYKVMSKRGPMSADDVAVESRCHRRLVREWLDSQAAAGLVDYDADSDIYELSEEGSLVLAEDEQMIFLARGMNAVGAMFIDIDKVKAAFRSEDGALSWAQHSSALFKGTEWLLRPLYRSLLPTVWIPSLDGVVQKLEKGARVADVGCGHGASTVAMATMWPDSVFFGFDYHGPSIEASKEHAKRSRASNTIFETADAKGYEGTFDLICFIDCLHDMGDPVGIARYARQHLANQGTLMLVEPFALDGRSNNIANNPLASAYYVSSSFFCTPNSLSQEVGLGLGAQAGPAKLRDVLEQAGFSKVRVAMDSQTHLIIEGQL